MKIDIVQIGNSKGIRIPKAILKQCGFTSNAELHVEDDKIIVIPIKGSIREGWERKFKKSAISKDDTAHDIQTFSNEFDLKDWQW